MPDPTATMLPANLKLMNKTLENTLDVIQAAEFTGYTPNYLYVLSHKGKIPCFRSRGRLRFLEKDLELWACLKRKVHELAESE